MQVTGLYLAAMDAIYAVAPKMLMAVEGCGQLAMPGLNWGDGFASKPEVVHSRVNTLSQISRSSTNAVG